MHTPESFLDQARQALAHKQPDHAERLAQRAIGLAPSLPAAWRVLADAQRSQGKHEDALKSRQHLARLASTSADAAFDVALELLSAGHEEQALAHMHELLKRWPDHVEALLQMGVLLAQRSALPEALPCMEKAVHLRPDHAKARNNLGVALAQANRPQEAIEHLREAQRLDPAYAEAGYNLGNVLGMLNRRDEAIAAYYRALDLKPDHYGVLNNLELLLQEASIPATQPSCCGRRSACAPRRRRPTTTWAWSWPTWADSSRPRRATTRRSGSTPAMPRRIPTWAVRSRS
jgi:tetratricopeptide (TPR) repeat protein